MPAAKPLPAAKAPATGGTSYNNAGTPMDTNGPKAILAGAVNRANDRNNPKPVYYDNEGKAYGPGAPYGSPDSQMPNPGTKPNAATLGAGLAAMVHGRFPHRSQTLVPAASAARRSTVHVA